MNSERSVWAADAWLRILLAELASLSIFKNFVAIYHLFSFSFFVPSSFLMIL